MDFRLERNTESLDELVKKELSFFNQAKTHGRDYSKSAEAVLAEGVVKKVSILLKYPGLEELLEQYYDPNQKISSYIMLINALCDYYKDLEPVKLIELCCKVAVAVGTQGVTTTPLEGLISIEEDQEEHFLKMNFAGPVRAAGASTIGILLCVADWLRQRFNIPAYKITDLELKRCITEVFGYPKLLSKHSVKNIESALVNYPIMISGPPTELEEVAAFKFVPRIKTPRYRGGFCLIVDSLITKCSKNLKTSIEFGLDWHWLKDIEKNKLQMTRSGSSNITSSIGRPIISSAKSKAGLRLRVGRSANTLMGGAGLHPSTIELIGFTNVGGQLVTTYPGKGASVNGCTDLDRPLVLTKKGLHYYNHTVDTFEDIINIVELGQILISFGEFCEYNRPIPARDYCKGLWRKATNYELDQKLLDESLALSTYDRYPTARLHPDYNIHLNNLNVNEYSRLRAGFKEGGFLPNFETLLIKGRIPFTYKNNFLVPENPLSLRYVLMIDEVFDLSDALEYNSLLEFVNAHYKKQNKLLLGEKGSCYLDVRIGRAESVQFRQLTPDCNFLAPSPHHQKTSMTLKDLDRKSKLTISRKIRYCPECKLETFELCCLRCKNRLEVHYFCKDCDTYDVSNQEHKQCYDCSNRKRYMSDYEPELKLALEKLPFSDYKNLKLKFLEQTTTLDFYEPLMKGFLRAIHKLSVSRDGTCRLNVSNAGTTHFRPKDIPNTSLEILRNFGYTHDVNGKPLLNEHQILSMKFNDCIVGRNALKELFRITKFIDDLLIYYYDSKPYYNAETLEDLLGLIVMSLAPHTSSAAFLRIIGYNETNVHYRHPIAVAAGRRNLDGDQDLLILASDVYLNFSYGYLHSDKIGALMNVPITVSSHFTTEEVDKEFLNVETGTSYPDLPNDRPLVIEEITQVPRVVLEKKKAEQIAYNYNTPGFELDLGSTRNLYKDLDSSAQKFELVLEFQKKINIDYSENIVGLLEGHLLRDLVGNTNAYFRQTYKCNSCGYKCHKPLSTTCCNCKKGILRNTVYPRMVAKYVKLISRLLNEYQLPTYLVQKVELALANIAPFIVLEEESFVDKYFK